MGGGERGRSSLGLDFLERLKIYEYMRGGDGMMGAYAGLGKVPVGERGA